MFDSLRHNGIVLLFCVHFHQVFSGSSLTLYFLTTTYPCSIWAVLGPLINRYKSLMLKLKCTCGVQKKCAIFHYKKRCCFELPFAASFRIKLKTWELSESLWSCFSILFVNFVTFCLLFQTYTLNLYLKKIIKSEILISVHLL